MPKEWATVLKFLVSRERIGGGSEVNFVHLVIFHRHHHHFSHGAPFRIGLGKSQGVRRQPHDRGIFIADERYAVRKSIYRGVFEVPKLSLMLETLDKPNPALT